MKFTLVVLVVVGVFGILEGKESPKAAIKKMERSTGAALKDVKTAAHALKKISLETMPHAETPKVFIALKQAKRELKKVQVEGAKAIKKSN